MVLFLLFAFAACVGSLAGISLGKAYMRTPGNGEVVPAEPAGRKSKAAALTMATLFSAIAAAIMYWISSGQMAASLGAIAGAMALGVIIYVARTLR